MLSDTIISNVHRGSSKGGLFLVAYGRAARVQEIDDVHLYTHLYSTDYRAGYPSSMYYDYCL